MLIQHPSKVIKCAEIKGFDDTDETDIRYTFTSDLQEYFTSEAYWTRDNPRESIFHFRFNLRLTNDNNQDAVVAIFMEVINGFKNMFGEVSSPQVIKEFCPETGDFMVVINLVCLRAVGSKAPPPPPPQPTLLEAE